MSTDPNRPSKTEVIRPAFVAGQSLKHFRLEGLLGEGGMGLVYRAHDDRLHRPVAVKLLAPELIADPERKERFLQEARAAARISHPAVAQIHYVDEQDGVAFIVMELVEGKTVRQLIQSGELDLLGALDIGQQVAEGLAKAHELGIVHRDIKPANVMLTPDGHAKILDFGLAKLLDRAAGEASTSLSATTSSNLTRSGVVMGTAAYMSPEQARGMPVDHRADLFSLGVMLYEMATGQSPFQRESFVDTLHAVAFDEAPSMTSHGAHLPEALQRIVSRCLQKRGEDRYPAARELAQDLRKLRRDTEAGRAQGSSWRQQWVEAWAQLRQVPRSRYAWIGLGLAGLALVSYVSLSLLHIGVGGAVCLVVALFVLYRYGRNRPGRIQASLVRRVAKIPEVRIIGVQQRQMTVVVDRPIAQLYGRINRYVQSSNRKRFFGQPMTVSIQHDLTPAELRKLLASPGVQYVREDVVGPPQAHG